MGYMKKSNWIYNLLFLNINSLDFISIKIFNYLIWISKEYRWEKKRFI